MRTLSAVFEGDLTRKAYNLSSILSSPASRALTVSPYSLAPLVQFIQSARSSIRIENQYLHEDHVNQALIEAAKRHVKVEILVSSACAFQTPTPKEQDQVRQIYAAFDAAGIKSRMFTSALRIKGVSGYLHAKAIVVDDAKAWVGSVNGSVTALTNNREFGLFFADRVSVTGLSRRFDQDFSSAGTESWEESLHCLKDTH